ncbi:lipoprotein [uncultured Marinobacter sp.]|uniref:LPS translocon maturation chaperone LptM n=1 Tax=uncultured Marinobacter sp. TaxID=187379 RepID=UPI00262E8CA1|nr:lipoprotein [uncultured Marinobacter sp.]
MQTWKTVSVGLVLVSVMAGCGQKGPLYREVPDEAAAEAVGEGRNNGPDSRQDEKPSAR